MGNALDDFANGLQNQIPEETRAEFGDVAFERWQNPLYAGAMDKGLLTLIRAIPQAKTIIVTAPNKIGGERAKIMINFFRKEKISIFGWIENMRGFICQHCGKSLELVCLFITTNSEGNTFATNP